MFNLRKSTVLILLTMSDDVASSSYFLALFSYCSTWPTESKHKLSGSAPCHAGLRSLCLLILLEHVFNNDSCNKERKPLGVQSNMANRSRSPNQRWRIYPQIWSSWTITVYPRRLNNGLSVLIYAWWLRDSTTAETLE